MSKQEGITAISDDDVARCEQQLDYNFGNKNLLKRALTHSSLRLQDGTCNERLEFLGDAVLGLVVSEFLFTTFRDFDEGELSLIKSTVVSRATLAKKAEIVQLPEFFAFASSAKGKTNKTKNDKKLPTSVLANVFEAIIGAIYLDSGLEPARKFILDNLRNDIESTIKNPYQKNYKTLLQFIAQKYLGTTPTYKMLKVRGANHEKIFTACAVVGKRQFVAADGKNKKEAEQLAAYAALQILSLEDPVIAENIQKNLSPEETADKSCSQMPSLFHNSKSLLQHVTQKYRLPAPIYKRVHVSVEREKKFFYVTVALRGRSFPEAKATRVKEAERLAARNALSVLSEEYSHASSGLLIPLRDTPPRTLESAPPLWHMMNWGS